MYSHGETVFTKEDVYKKGNRLSKRELKVIRVIKNIIMADKRNCYYKKANLARFDLLCMDNYVIKMNYYDSLNFPLIAIKITYLIMNSKIKTTW